MADPKFTVIIPTRERDDVLGACLKTVTAQDYDNLEIIVSDNVSGDETREIVQATRDSRIRYINPGRRLSMSHHWEFALSHASGGWYTIIGDDDGLLPNSISRAAQIASDTGVQAIKSDPCMYSWPSITGKAHGTLRVPLGSKISVRASKKWLSRLMKGYATYFELPMLYHGGYIHSDVISKVKKITGCFYRSCQPDIYSSVAVASIAERYVFVSEPLGIGGLSARSNGAAFLYGQPGVSGGLSEKEKFLSEDNIPFHRDIPSDAEGLPLFKNEVLVYESYLQSAPLRGTYSSAMHTAQLLLIIGTAGELGPSGVLWARKFASLHGIDYEAVRKKSRFFRFKIFPGTIPSRVRRGINTTELGSASLPIRDVFEASIAAAALRESVPGRLHNILTTAQRAAAKLGDARTAKRPC
jgi:glycosyltransferase involved in cell wall biosynthesis